jgi:hypothetical protein
MFFRAFWCFGQCVEAFSHCKPVLSIDGTFLTSKYKGTLLIAISIDAVNRLLPLAFAFMLSDLVGLYVCCPIDMLGFWVQ